MTARSHWGVLLALSVTLAAAGCGSGSGNRAASSASRVATRTPSPSISTEWTEYHRDSTRSGLGPATPALTAPQVAWKATVDSDVYASPLIVAGHVIVATENNTVYSLDLFSGTPIWKIHLGDPVDSSSLPCGDIGPVTGITGTPAADLATGRLYVVAFLRTHHHMLFALSLTDGSVVSQRDVDPPGSNPSVQQERGALAIGSGYVYIPFGGLFGDCGPYHGYVDAVSLTNGALLSYAVPSSRGAGIWTPAGPTLDSKGNVYVVTGNGESRSSFDYSNSVIELSPDLQTVKSYFAPANWVALNAGDTDLGALGVTVMPSAGLVVAVGKDGVAYVMRAGQLGGIGGQVTSRRVCEAAFGGTAWTGSTVLVPCTNGLFALSVGGGSVAVQWFVGHPALGSPILAAGAVWGIEPGSGTLYALNPSTGATLYSTSLGAAAHFSTPAATEGFVVAPVGNKVMAILTLG